MRSREAVTVRLGLIIPTLLFVLFFVISSGIIVTVFIRSAAVSRKADELNYAVQLCRNAAEIYNATGSEERAAELTAQYIAEQETSGGITGFELRFRDAAGDELIISVSDAYGNELYSLPVIRQGG